MAALELRLKKPFLDHEDLKKFRSISNLKFLSKITEKIIADQMIDYISKNDMTERFQSAYKQHHSTETALIRVHNNISCAIDDGRSVLLLLLDLSSAFNTIDHGILLSRLTQKYGFCETVHDWFSSYLSGRSQFVSVNGGSSTKTDLPYDVPQGSVLWPLLFLLYTAPLADVIRKHDMNYHLYADNNQVYLSFQSSVVHETEAAKAKMEACI